MSGRDDRDAGVDLAAACPAPIGRYDHVVLGHGSGGRLSAQLLAEVFLPAFDNPVLARLEDQAVLPDALAAELARGGQLAVTTDAFVVRPLVFPGGDIGRLAVHGTLNDLAVGGAVPRCLTAAFVLEEGLSFELLRRVVGSMRAACDAAGVALVAGDTKVVDRGRGDGVYIATTGVGVVPPERRGLTVSLARPGDAVLASGPLGDHGIAVLSVREGIAFDTALESDTADVTPLVAALLAAAPARDAVRCMRDPTRGGAASALNEIAAASRVGIVLEESAIPLRDEVRTACELLGLDPLYVASEGRLLALVAPGAVDAALAAMRAHPLGHGAAVIGRVVAADPGQVALRTRIGGERVVAMLAGEQLPRIC